MLSHLLGRYLMIVIVCETCNYNLSLQVLAKKMTVLYKLASGQLSKQSHYDFGLRALKAVLVMAGELKRGSPDLSEVSLILIRVKILFFLCTTSTTYY